MFYRNKILVTCLLLVLLGFISFLVLQRNQSQITSCSDCFVATTKENRLVQIYQDPVLNFSIRYPADYRIDTSYNYQGLGPGKEIKGVKFLIPISLATGTNLSSYDTGVSVETIPFVEKCEASLFLPGEISAQDIVEHGVTYSFAQVQEGAAGNRYEEQVWALKDSSPCFAVRYFIHSTVVENYPEGTIIEFDKTSLINTFDQIRSSLNTL